MSTSGSRHYGHMYGPLLDRRAYAEVRFGDGHERNREVVSYDNVHRQPRRDREFTCYGNYDHPRRDHGVVFYDDSYCSRGLVPYEGNHYGSSRELDDTYYILGSRRNSYGPEVDRHHGGGYGSYERGPGYGHEVAPRHNGSYGGGISNGGGFAHEPNFIHQYYDNQAGDNHYHNANYPPDRRMMGIYREGGYHRLDFRSSGSVASSTGDSSRALSGDPARVVSREGPKRP